MALAEQYTETIKRAAREAAESSIDAHGGLVECRMAYDFIREQVYSETEPWTADMLPEAMPCLFAEEYAKHGKEMGANFV